MNKSYLKKIIAKDSNGLQMISACCSGAIVKISDMKYLIFDKNINHVLKKLEEIELLYKRRNDEFSKFLQPDLDEL